MAGNRDLEASGGGKTRGAAHPPPPSYGTAASADSAWPAFLVPLIVLANLAIFVIIMSVNDCPNRIGKDEKCVARFLRRFSFQPLRENPLFGPASSRLEKLGALDWNKIVHEHQEWRLFTCIWLHAGVIHLLANMVSLVFIGIRLEQQFGFIRVGILYLVSGIGGSILSSLFIQHSISVGASGALFGLLGAMLSELLTNWTIYSNKAAALFTLVVIIAVNLAVGILPHVDNFAHIGGFLSGFLLGFVLLLRPQFGWYERQYLPPGARLNSKYTVCQLFCLVFTSVLLLTGYVVGLVMLLRGENGNSRCGWCHYLSCVPTSRWQCNN
ncbi:hypothetical protein DM860_006779 [Cuscuta australis]|uniref:RHOMBOID-like protein n=1 Tax=Cuscuta australis TaxID=267555 RepID=A0A328E583_9ASTE|nr:hypothetical protein DM860_006779 [Cuscuta australis]